MRFEVPDVEEYLNMIADTAGPLGLALNSRRQTTRRCRFEVEDSLSRFATDHGYEFPGVALCAVAD